MARDGAAKPGSGVAATHLAVQSAFLSMMQACHSMRAKLIKEGARAVVRLRSRFQGLRCQQVPQRGGEVQEEVEGL